MKDRPARRHHRRKTGGAVLTATALLAALLVSMTTGISSAAPVSAEVPAMCAGADKDSLATLALAKALIGSDKVAVKLLANSKGSIPANAGIGDEINAAFDWKGTLDQNLIDKAADLKLALKITKVKTEMLVKGPSDQDRFTATGPDANVSAVKGAPAVLSLGSIGGPITTTGGGIITYRVGLVTLTASLSLSGQNFVINMKCATVGSNLIAKTTVKDPDAPTFTPDVVKLKANAGETVTVDLLDGVIQPGKTPLIPDSLKIAENPGAGSASISGGVFSFTAPSTPGTYSTTVEICGEPKADSGIPGVDEVQKIQLGTNWSGDGILAPRPVAFTLKFGEQETKLIWTARQLLGFPLPLADGSPTPDNWAPANAPGLINTYALQTTYQPPTAAGVQAALEALPGIGAGNVAVTDLKENEGNPNLVTGFAVTYTGELAQQDVPELSLGQWYTVPPQELLDSIGEAVAGIAGGMGGDDDAPPGPMDGMTPEQADAYIGNKLVASITGGPAVTDAEWDAWVKIRIINPIMDQVPAIIAWITSLFPEKLITSTLTAGEVPTPPQDLCAQGIIDVTVSGPGTQVEGTVEFPTGIQAAKEPAKISLAG